MNNGIRWKIIIVVLLMGFSLPEIKVRAQETTPTEYPIYIIQPGDTLATVALQFGISLDDLIAINNIENPNSITIGMEIILPGMEGISGVLTTVPIILGDSLRSLSVQYQIDEDDLIRINKLSSHSELYLDGNLILPVGEQSNRLQTIGQINGLHTTFEMAIVNHMNEWQLSKDNLNPTTWNYPILTPVYTFTSTPDTLPFAIGITSLTLSPEGLKQGDAAMIRLSVNQPLDHVTGSLGDYQLHFFEEEPDVYVAYQGIHAQLDPGLLPLTISGGDEVKEIFSFEQWVQVSDSLYPFESLVVDPKTIDPQTMDSEQAMILEITSPVTPEKNFNIPFQCMLDQPTCIRSWYGTNRNYNDGVYYNFHSGLDYGVCASLNIYAPANGTVVYAGLLTVRGNTTYIDHGWGIYSGFFHQDQILVNEGDQVTAGQLIGIIGATGRVTGAHLHYEIIVNGVHIDPLQWLDENCQ